MQLLSQGKTRDESLRRSTASYENNLTKMLIAILLTPLDALSNVRWDDNFIRAFDPIVKESLLKVR
jgi:hypothetical protein